MLKVLSGLFFISIRMTKGIEETHDLGKHINLKRNIHNHNSCSIGMKIILNLLIESFFSR